MLSFALFERHVRHLVVTEKGLELAVTVNHLLNELRLNVAALREDCGNERLRIACTHSFAMEWLLPRLHRYSVRHPEMDIHIESDDEVVDVSRDACDIAIRHQSYVAGEDSNLLWREQLLLAYTGSLLSARDQEAAQSLKLKRLLRYPLLYESTPEN
ncbi:LysR substrate-binding domain-containing protein [Undibacterium sp. TJN19]|uniref:LysR substrate-binding domain-containing protein n=1 Tax=Undibacterium sp. TJN19 TaxID=3413055 RepID=UPI003BF1E461